MPANGWPTRRSTETSSRTSDPNGPQSQGHAKPELPRFPSRMERVFFRNVDGLDTHAAEPLDRSAACDVRRIAGHPERLHSVGPENRSDEPTGSFCVRIPTRGRENVIADVSVIEPKPLVITDPKRDPARYAKRRNRSHARRPVPEQHPELIPRCPAGPV